MHVRHVVGSVDALRDANFDHTVPPVLPVHIRGLRQPEPSVADDQGVNPFRRSDVDLQTLATNDFRTNLSHGVP